MRLITTIKTFKLKPCLEKIKFIINKLEGNCDVNACIFVVLEINSEACLCKYDHPLDQKQDNFAPNFTGSLLQNDPT